MYLGGGCYNRSVIALLFQLRFYAMAALIGGFLFFFFNKIMYGNFVGQKLIIKAAIFFFLVVENQVQGKQSPQNLF